METPSPGRARAEYAEAVVAPWPLRRDPTYQKIVRPVPSSASCDDSPCSMSMDSPHEPPSPAPWVFKKHLYGLPHCLLDRDGRVIGSYLALPNGPMMAEAPVMAELLRSLVAGAVDMLKVHAVAILRRIDLGRCREPGKDDE